MGKDNVEFKQMTEVCNGIKENMENISTKNCRSWVLHDHLVKLKTRSLILMERVVFLLPAEITTMNEHTSL